MIVYYAGHGGTVKTPAGFVHAADGGDGESAGESISEVVLPHDVYTPDKTHPTQLVQPIPDTTLNRLLSELAVTKGDNIVRPSLLNQSPTHA